MKALVTGGCGFIGQHLARRLADRYDLECIDVLHPQVHLDPEGAKAAFPGRVIVGDVTNRAAWDQASRPDVVIHLAAETGTAQSMYEVERYRSVNVGGTRAAAEAAAGWGVPLVAMSSRAVYGEGRYAAPSGEASFDTPVPGAVPEASREDDPHRPVSVYGETKSEGEAIAAEFADRIGIGIIRPQNVVGPGQALHNPYTGVFVAWLARMREGLPLLVYGDGLATRDIVHVSDVAALIDWVAEQLIQRGAGEPIVLNCGTGERSSLTDMAGYAIAGSPSGEAVIEHVEVHRAGDIEHACADLSRGVAMGAPRPQWTSQEAIKQFIAWSWDKPGASSQAWDAALAELADKGLAT